MGGQFSSLFSPLRGCSERSWGGEGTRTFALSRPPVPASAPKSSGPARSHGLPFLPQPRQSRLPLQTVFFLGESYFFFFHGHVESGMDESCRENLLRGGGRAPNLPCCSPASSRPGCPRGGRAEAVRGRGGRSPSPGRAAALSAPFPAAVSARGSK